METVEFSFKILIPLTQKMLLVPENLSLARKKQAHPSTI